MECPCSWTVLCAILYFTIQSTAVYGQIEPLEEITTNYQTNELKRDVSKSFIPFANPYIQDDILRSLNVISQSPQYYSQDLAAFGQPALISNGLNVVLRPQCSTLLPEPSCNGVPRIPVENYPNVVQPAPAVFQLARPPCDVPNYPTLINSLTPPLPIINRPGVAECEIDQRPVFQEPIILQNEYEDGIPLNLQINVPSPSAPRITVVSATPAVTSTNSESIFPFPQYPPPIPIIRKKSRSSLKSLLPILLIALLSEQDCGNGCCCPCDCNSDGPIPIPFPIPIPVNNPIINNDGSSCSSR